MNRELARRVRTVSGACVLKDMVKTDISMAKKLIEQLDEKYRVWIEEENKVKTVVSEPLKTNETKVEEKDEEKSEVSEAEIFIVLFERFLKTVCNFYIFPVPVLC